METFDRQKLSEWSGLEITVTNIVYDDAFGINTFKREICAALGEEFWEKLVEGIVIPDAAL